MTRREKQALAEAIRKLPAEGADKETLIEIMGDAVIGATINGPDLWAKWRAACGGKR